MVVVVVVNQIRHLGDVRPRQAELVAHALGDCREG